MMLEAAAKAKASGNDMVPPHRRRALGGQGLHAPLADRPSGSAGAARAQESGAWRAEGAVGWQVLLGERGSFFGYADLVVDPRNIIWMQARPAARAPP